ncbi:hypothetical protein EB796_009330 [Bugula neritina]|uniref:Uncharacterized protein n=1 Tax=Bugula neritina TaxID=10212 RepID=A0A7J7K159_BUGNE|nr:hypothetical protein EB796_009330 [Bugula neritina]
MQKKRNPSLMMDVPVILHKDLQDLQKKMANERLSSKPALPLIVQKLMVKHKLTKIQQDSEIGDCAEGKLGREETGTKTGCENLSSVSEKQLHKRSLQKRKTTYIEDTKNRVTVTSSKSLKKSTDLLDIKENVNSSTKPLNSGGNSHNTELPKSADNSHITELPKSADNSHKTELPKSADNSHKTELPKSADNSHKTELLKSGDNPHNMELPKTRITLVAKMWKAKAVDASNKYFKELHGAKELNSQLSQNKECHAPPVNAEQQKEQTTQVFMSHEGSEQMVVNRQNPSADTVFVRLGLLISKDVFGLETLKFDVNYKVSDTSVCLVSRGAEVLMIRKKFFMDHCNSANLEHLRNTISPYPTEISMQRNLQVSFDWNRYSKQQVKDILDDISLKKSCKTSLQYMTFLCITP